MNMTENEWLTGWYSPRFKAQMDYRRDGCFRNPYERHTDDWRAYHAEESKRLFKKIRGED